ncbi:MAG: agmatine deiminase family protein [Gammaproteobacteria bacterium]|nr:agmatine deiminase family protein [Gammaproteobacteria bacterium]
MKTLPAEWAPQSGIMLTWPHVHSDWDENLEETEQVFIDIAKAISQQEIVLISCFDSTHRQHIEQILIERGVSTDRLQLHIQPSNDTWARDHGPITIIENNQPVLLDFKFNGWGGKYPAELDTQITRGLSQQGAFADIPVYSIPLILEGGSIDSDGEGSLITTEACLLTPTRNPEYNKTQLEQELKKHLGIKRILWLKHGHLEGDDTDSHIDMLARFCNTTTIAYSSCDDPADSHYNSLQKMRSELEELTTIDGKPYRLIPLPIPGAKYDAAGKRLPGSYANFLIINNAVLVPVYDDPMDQVALDNLSQAFPQRVIMAINCLPLIQQYGSLHCLSMQLPSGVLPE